MGKAGSVVFISNFLVEFFSGLYCFFNPEFLFPGLNSTGLLAAEMFALAIMSLGLLSLHSWHVQQGGVTVSLACLVYHFLLVVNTAYRWHHGLQIDGPAVPGVSPDSLALCGIAVHGLFSLGFVHYIVYNSQHSPLPRNKGQKSK
eukprot:TRINITY_DN11594_c0_g1_i1.p1 TRINITY_DN11594_c0_g1~~TRINITY_DN11594_c0_g1_i1.p1  ORF type:complete len:145 (+),score=6.83 TRINITY_DN11594_c0_g1_i1:19-453(+)